MIRVLCQVNRVVRFFKNFLQSRISERSRCTFWPIWAQSQNAFLGEDVFHVAQIIFATLVGFIIIANVSVYNLKQCFEFRREYSRSARHNCFGARMYVALPKRHYSHIILTATMYFVKCWILLNNLDM